MHFIPTFRPNKSAARTVDLLSLLAKAEGPLSIAEISREMSIPKSSMFELVYTLVDKGFLEIADSNLNTFKLGLKIFEVGISFVNKINLHREARPQMEYLMAQTGRTVFLAIEDQGQVVYIDKLEPISAVFTGALLGSRNPMYCTGLGKAMLAAYSEDKVRSITGGGEFEPKTKYSITNYNDLLEELAAIRARGYSIDNRENEEHIFCIAVPIYDRSGNAIAAISVANPAAAIDGVQIERTGALAQAAALKISKKLGFLGEKIYP